MSVCHPNRKPALSWEESGRTAVAINVLNSASRTNPDATGMSRSLARTWANRVSDIVDSREEPGDSRKRKIVAEERRDDRRKRSRSTVGSSREPGITCDRMRRIVIVVLRDALMDGKGRLCHTVKRRHVGTLGGVE